MDEYEYDPELESFLADIEDVANGVIVDSAHAEAMNTMVGKLCDLQETLDVPLNSNQEFTQIMNGKTIDEINELHKKLDACREQVIQFFKIYHT